MSQAAVANMEDTSSIIEQKVASTGMSNAQAETEAAKRGRTLIIKPDNAPRGWLSSEKRKNPNVITKAELEEMIRMEEFSAATENLKQSGKRR